MGRGANLERGDVLGRHPVEIVGGLFGGPELQAENVVLLVAGDGLGLDLLDVAQRNLLGALYKEYGSVK